MQAAFIAARNTYIFWCPLATTLTNATKRKMISPAVGGKALYQCIVLERRSRKRKGK